MNKSNRERAPLRPVGGYTNSNYLLYCLWDSVSRKNLGSTTQFGKKPRREIFRQVKVWKAKEYCMYFELFKPQNWRKRSGEARRQIVRCCLKINEALDFLHIGQGLQFLPKYGKLAAVLPINGKRAAPHRAFAEGETSFCALRHIERGAADYGYIRGLVPVLYSHGQCHRPRYQGL